MMPMQSPSQMSPQMPSGDGAFLQAAQGRPSGPPMPPGSQPSQPMNPQVILQMIGTLSPQVQQMLAQQVLQNAAQQGRGGDTMIAHLTPGEKTVPPEVQTPKVLATLNKAYKEKGVKPQQFTAGAPQSSKNPSTGLPEYNFMSAFLPAAMGIAGAAAAPFTGGASLGLSEAAMAAIGGGLGSTAGGLLAGETPTQAALGGLGSAAGGYALSGMGGAAGSAAGDAGKAALTPAQAAVMSAKDPAAAYAAGGQMGLNMASPATSAGVMGPPAPGLSNLWGQLPAGSINPGQIAGSAAGGYIGNALGAPPKSNPPNYPPGFNTPMDPIGSHGSAQEQLGMNNSKQPMPSFSGFNPLTNYPASYNFYPGG